MSIENAISDQQTPAEMETTETQVTGMYPDGNIKPRLQNRKVHVFMWLKLMPDGVTYRVEQLFDAPIAFSCHRELVMAINEARMEAFGDNGKLYETKNMDLPGADVTVRCFIFNSKSGKRIGMKVFNGDEAKVFMTKVRTDLENTKIRFQSQFGDNNAEGFNTLHDAMNTASEKREIAVNN